MLVTIMMSARHGTGSTLVADVDPAEWERVEGILIPAMTQRILSGGSDAPPGNLGRAGSQKSTSLQPPLEYRFDQGTSEGQDPGSGRYRINHADPALATLLMFDRLSVGGIDVSLMLTLVEIDNEITIHEKNFALHSQVWRKTGPTENRADWFAMPIAYVSGAAFAGNTVVMVLTKARPESFLALTDTPIGYAGSGGNAVAVRMDETGIEYVPFPISTPGGGETFLSLSDTPADYIGQAGRAVTVRPDESGVEFTVLTPGTPGDGGSSDAAASVTPWMQCTDPRTGWPYLLNLAEVMRIGPAHTP